MFIILFFLILILLPNHAICEDTDTSFSVSANVVSTGTIQVTDLDFGDYNYAEASLGECTITYQATDGSVGSIELDIGANSQGSQRRMKGPGGDYLNYRLCTDQACSAEWPITGISFEANGSTQTMSIFGQVPQDQKEANPGTYTDTVTATLKFE